MQAVPRAVRGERARLGGLPRGSFGATLAHAGLGVTIAGIAGMSLAQSVDRAAAARPGTTHLGGYDWHLVELHDAPGPNYAARVATIEVSRNGHLVTMLAPERRSFPVQQITTTDAKISTNGFRDLYAVLGDERDGGAVLRLHVNPLAPWIWLGALIMACGGMLSLADRRLRVGAPMRRAARRAGRAGAMNRRLLLLAPFGVSRGGRRRVPGHAEARDRTARSTRAACRAC